MSSGVPGRGKDAQVGVKRNVSPKQIRDSEEGRDMFLPS